MENEFIRKLAEALELEENKISTSDKFKEYEEWDSLAVLSVLAMINEEFDITIPRQDFEKLETVKDIYNYIIEKRGRNG